MIDAKGRYADTSHMHSVHAMFRREFGLLPALVRSVADDHEQKQVVTSHITLLNLVLHHHHSGEDRVLWPLLRARGPREIEPVVRLVEGHHRAMDAHLTEIDPLLRTWAGTTTGKDGEALAKGLEELGVLLHAHMGLEEELVLPIAEQHIFAGEWDTMVAEEAATVPAEVGPVLAGMLMYEGGLEVVPPAMRSVLANRAPQAYAAHCERVHGTPTPPRSCDVEIGTPSVGVAAARRLGSSSDVASGGRR